jgi:hypothetical protein
VAFGGEIKEGRFSLFASILTYSHLPKTNVLYVKWVLFLNPMASSDVADRGNDIQMSTADKGWFFRLGVERWANEFLP